MKEALEKLITKIVLPKYGEINFKVMPTGKIEIGKGDTYLVRFTDLNISLPQVLRPALVYNTINLMQSLGFYDVKEHRNNMTYDGNIIDIIAKF